jgi:hypothetical protein
MARCECREGSFVSEGICQFTLTEFEAEQAVVARGVRGLQGGGVRPHDQDM